jgi:hypothetical protein
MNSEGCRVFDARRLQLDRWLLTRTAETRGISSDVEGNKTANCRTPFETRNIHLEVCRVHCGTLTVSIKGRGRQIVFLRNCYTLLSEAQEMSCSQEHVVGTMDTILSRVTILLNRPSELSGNPIAPSSNKTGATGEVNDEFCLRHYLFHCPKGFYFPSERRRAADLYRPRPGLNSRTLGPMASMLTTRPPRTTTET